MTIEEAKKDFDLIKRALNKRRLCPCGYCVSDKCIPLTNECLKDDFVINIALEALEKQIPKKAIPCSPNSTWTKCPVCGDTTIDQYCGKCGQRLDWEDE